PGRSCRGPAEPDRATVEEPRAMSTERHARAPGFHDPRMRGFRSRTSVDEVISLIDARVNALPCEPVALCEAAGRVLAAEVVAGTSRPPFDRAAMDGYAVRGEETHGADAYTPAILRLVGVARPGRAFGGTVSPGEAVEIATGAPIPAEAD